MISRLDRPTCLRSRSSTSLTQRMYSPAVAVLCRAQRSRKLDAWKGAEVELLEARGN